MYTPIYNLDEPYDTDLYSYDDVALIYDAVFNYNYNVEYGGDVDTSNPASTLNDELNRLANGGLAYPPYSLYKDQAGAAQAWAAVRSVDLQGMTDLVGVINYIGGITERNEMLDIAGICNYIANTTGLEPAAALRQVAS